VNTDTLKGQWNQLKGQLKVQWGKLTDDDLDKIEGNRDILIGKLQEHYGRTRDEVERDVDLWLEEQRVKV
jgi:uncharacterized protein YjbJ (UPF0337 family)